MEELEKNIQSVHYRETSFGRRTEKKTLFSHVVGMDVQENYFTLAADAESAILEETVKVLDDCFFLKAKVPFERPLFRQIVQESEETVGQFVCRLCQ